MSLSLKDLDDITRIKFHPEKANICEENLLNCNGGEVFFQVFSAWDSKGGKENKYCRSRQEFSNEPLLAKLGVGTPDDNVLERDPEAAVSVAYRQRYLHPTVIETIARCVATRTARLLEACPPATSRARSASSCPSGTACG